MSLSQSLSAAFSGLDASARAAEQVATNLANLRTPGFGRRDLQLSSSLLGGVQVTAVLRQADMAVTADRRLAQAQSSGSMIRLEFLKTLEGGLGQPGAPGALTGQVTRLETALLAASAEPQSQARLSETLDAARSLTEKLRALSGQVQQARMDADSGIARDVATLNQSLRAIAALNRDIQAMSARNQDPSALIDQRQLQIDRVSEIIPVREIARHGNRVALMTPGGATLLDNTPAEFGFAAAGWIAPESGALSGLTLNGQPIAADSARIAGGRLAAAFALRDDWAPAAQQQLDAFARDMMTRLERADTTRPPGGAGLLTDGGGAFDPAAELGLAARIGINALADPEQGGGLWRLRDGIGASLPGDVGNAALLDAMGRELGKAQPTASGDFLPGNRTAAGLAGDILSGVATARLSAETSASQASATLGALQEQEAAAGVDSDREMQLLLLIERAYGANARVIQTVDRMLQTLQEI